MAVRTSDVFTTIRSEGMLLPSELLLRIVDNDPGLEGLSPADYHLSGERINEAISNAWNRVRSAWRNFRVLQETLPDSDAGTTLTRERWLLPLFTALDYGRLQTTSAATIDNKSYPISHRWRNIPIHLVSFRVDIDRRTPGMTGAATSSPHSLMQMFLNRSLEHSWGFVSNGCRLRILRDNSSMTRQAYVEFNLEAMMDGEVYADFALFWMLCHQSRVEAANLAECWLERWTKAADEQGTRALDQLRDSVQDAIKALGTGFIKHSKNRVLREKLRTGVLDKQDYYRQLLRLVYRFLFLFTAEDRDLLLDPDAPEETQELYQEHYSVRRVREIAGHFRGTTHLDQFEGLRLVMRLVGGYDNGKCALLGLPVLGSSLFDDSFVGDIIDCKISNRDLLEAIRALAFIQDRETGTLRPVDYKHLGPEELGGVYESLLELHPEVNLPAYLFTLETAGGHDRKTTGSYFTPAPLISALLDSALDPVLGEVLKARDPERAILQLKVCDPACGSGSFLIAAAHRIAHALARVRAGEDEPSPSIVRSALRDVIGSCIYGVDINPMSVELCKVNLWIEALDPGKPLSFLDHHIKVGNSLLGTTPALMAQGIPDSAFEPLEGDDRAVATTIRKQNRQERKDLEKGQRSMFEIIDPPRHAILTTAVRQVDDIDDTFIAGVRAKEAQWKALANDPEYIRAHLIADAWCAAFVWEKKPNSPLLPMTQLLYERLCADPFAKGFADIREYVVKLREQYGFFHWHIAFPDVFTVPEDIDNAENEKTGWSSGFDVVLGNPPWDRIRPEAEKFFAASHPEITTLKRNERNEAIEALASTAPLLYAAWIEQRRKDLSTTHFLKTSNAFPLSTTKNVNSYAVFQELALHIVNPSGISGLILQSGIATDEINKDLFQYMMSSDRLIDLFDFENRLGLFPAVHRMMKFCLLSCFGSTYRQRPKFVCYATSVDDIKDDDRIFELTTDDLSLLAPNTGLLPTFRSRQDAELVKAIYSRAGVFVVDDREQGNSWEVNIRRLFSIYYDSADLVSAETVGLSLDNSSAIESNTWTRLYEAKLFHQFDHRFATYQQQRGVAPSTVCRDRELTERSPDQMSFPRYWATRAELGKRLANTHWDHPYFLAYRDVTNAMNERTCIASIIPESAPDDTIRLLLVGVGNARDYSALIANWNAFAFDFSARNVVASTHLSEYIAKQLPVLSPLVYTPDLLDFIVPRVLELSYTAWDLQPFAQDVGWDGPPFIWDEDRRFFMRCELDALYFHLYQIVRDDVDYIMETFPIVKRKDEAAYGEYRTKCVILEMYDQMAEAGGVAGYQTWLSLGPADPGVAHEDRR